jgi:N-acyl-D-amino-acid deacylase
MIAGTVTGQPTPNEAMPWTRVFAGLLPSRVRWTAVASLTLLVTAPVVATAQEIQATGTAVSELRVYDRVMNILMTAWQIPGGAVAISHEGRLVFARGYGLADRESGLPVRPDSLFRMASASKPITATAILKLIEGGRLELNVRAFKLLGHLKPPAGIAVDPRIDAITIRQLLQHTAGWDRDTTFDPMLAPTSRRAAEELGASLPPTCETIIRWMLRRRLDFDPGSRFAYSNLGYCVLGRVIERVTGQKYEDAVRELVLEPAGITRMRVGGTTLEERVEGEVRYYDHPGAPLAMSLLPNASGPVPRPYGGFNVKESREASGGWIASAIDLLRFVSGVEGRGRSIFQRPDTMRLIETRPDSPIAAGGTRYYGLGWFVVPAQDGRADWWHPGGYPGSGAVVARTRNGIALAVLFNSVPRDESGFAQELAQRFSGARREVTQWPAHDFFASYR